MTECSLDRKKYPPTTIGVFQLVAAHMTDIFYNHLYAEAKKMKDSGRVGTVTDGYKSRVWAFIQSLDSNNKKDFKAAYYTAFLKGINRYFQTYTKFETLNLSDCIDKVVNEFIPVDFYSQLNKDKKRDVLYAVLIGCLKEYARKIIADHCGMIIDEHSEEGNVDTLRELAVDLLIIERHRMYKKFLVSATGPVKADAIDTGLVRDLQRELHVLYKQRDDWAAEKAAMSSREAALSAAADEKQRYALQLLTKYKAAREEITALKGQLAAARTSKVSGASAGFLGGAGLASKTIVAEDDSDESEDEWGGIGNAASDANNEQRVRFAEPVVISSTEAFGSGAKPLSTYLSGLREPSDTERPKAKPKPAAKAKSAAKTLGAVIDMGDENGNGNDSVNIKDPAPLANPKTDVSNDKNTDDKGKNDKGKVDGGSVNKNDSKNYSDSGSGSENETESESDTDSEHERELAEKAAQEKLKARPKPKPRPKPKAKPAAAKPSVTRRSTDDLLGNDSVISSTEVEPRKPVEYVLSTPEPIDLNSGTSLKDFI